MANRGGRPPLCEVRKGKHCPDVDLAELRHRYPRHAQLYDALVQRIGGTLTLMDLREIVGIRRDDDRAIGVLRDLAKQLDAVEIEEWEPPGPRFTVTVGIPLSPEALPMNPHREAMVPLYYHRTAKWESADEHGFIRFWHATYALHRETAYHIEEPDWYDEVGDVRDEIHALLQSERYDHVRLARYVDTYLRSGVINVGRRRAFLDLYKWDVHRLHPFRIRTFLTILPDMAREIESAVKTLDADATWRRPPNIRAIELQAEIADALDSFDNAMLEDWDRRERLIHTDAGRQLPTVSMSTLVRVYRWLNDNRDLLRGRFPEREFCKDMDMCGEAAFGVLQELQDQGVVKIGWIRSRQRRKDDEYTAGLTGKVPFEDATS